MRLADTVLTVTNLSDKVVRILQTNVAPNRSIDVDDSAYHAWRVANAANAHLSIRSLTAVPTAIPDDPLENFRRPSLLPYDDDTESADE